MGRPREFDEKEVLSKAMRVFWLKGYEATSMTDLMGAMQLHKGSIYKAFGDKHNLFYLSLKAYMDQGREAAMQMMEGATSPREAVGMFMNMSLRQCACGDQVKGCFMINSIVELGPHDEQIRELIARFMESMRDKLVSTIVSGQKMGEIRTDTSARDLANYLISVKAGLLSASKVKMANHDPYVIAEFALSNLE